MIIVMIIVILILHMHNLHQVMQKPSNQIHNVKGDAFMGPLASSTTTVPTLCGLVFGVLAPGGEPYGGDPA